MAWYRVESSEGAVLGVVEAESKAGALDVVAQQAGYADADSIPAEIDTTGTRAVEMTGAPPAPGRMAEPVQTGFGVYDGAEWERLADVRHPVDNERGLLLCNRRTGVYVVMVAGPAFRGIDQNWAAAERGA